MLFTRIPSVFSNIRAHRLKTNHAFDTWPVDTRLQLTLCRQLSVILREPYGVVRRFVHQHQQYHTRTEHRRHRRLSSSALHAHANSFCVPHIEAYRELLAQDSRARILATYHFGDFAFGLNCLASRVSHVGRTCVLSLQKSSAAYWENLQVAFGAHAATSQNELLRHHTTVADLSGFLREAGNTLVLFTDLPHGSGEVTKVRFLTRWAWFPKGPATLAVLNRVPIVPVICITQAERNLVCIGPQIEPDGLTGESRDRRVGRITQRLVNMLEVYISQYPQQWRYLALLPRYFVPPSADVQ